MHCINAHGGLLKVGQGAPFECPARDCQQVCPCKLNVDLLHSHLKPRKRAALDIVTSVVFFIFTLALLWFGIDMAQESMSSWETSYSAWNPPIWPVKLAIPIGTGLLVLQGLVKLLEDIAVAFNLDYYTPQEPKCEGDQL